ncbi:MAG: cysteine--tRNA ligase [Sphaerospermopsis sp. SIO1G2]|nr:cysteine--tRNA ligase [Sphaerospermopsis sp. SIO1G2]
MSTPSITLNNSLSRMKETLDSPLPIGMYVCGPTVYDRPHIGNARSVVIYDVLFRLLRHVYGAEAVTYVRNITDVDDKINQAAVQRGISIQSLTQEVTTQFHEDMAALLCLPPTIEPKVTEHMDDIVAMIDRLVGYGHAYCQDGHVLFDVTSDQSEYWHYGMLSGRTIEEQRSGARIAVESYKRHPGDFVLWKPASDQDDASSVFDSPWGRGRPGWHIECSAMSTKYLGHDFAIHGGGADLKFPHHENEIAQSCCANPGSHYAKLWVHNGFLTVDGEKMSKSLGNFVTVKALLDQGIPAEVIRFALLSAHYAKPLDWTEKLIADARKQLVKLYKNIEKTDDIAGDASAQDVLDALVEDLNLPKAIAALHRLRGAALRKAGALLGLLQDNPAHWRREHDRADTSHTGHVVSDVDQLIAARAQAKAEKNWVAADRIRDRLKAEGILLVDQPDGKTSWKRV